jgi:hypothetical protein
MNNLGAWITAGGAIVGAVITAWSYLAVNRRQNAPTPMPGDPPILATSCVDLDTPLPQRTAKTGSCEKALRQQQPVQRLLGNKNWRDAAEAAIAYYARGEQCSVESWKRSSTWQQIKVEYDKLPQCRCAERETKRREPALR